MKSYFFAIALLVSMAGAAQSQTLNDDLIKLAAIWRKAGDDTRKELESITNPDLQASKEFIEESIKKKNKITTKRYITRPDSITLRHLFVIRWLRVKQGNGDQNRGIELIDSLNQSKPGTYEQLANYYEMVYSSVSNYNNPLDMSKVNFNMNEYGFKDDTEKNIFFFESMRTLGLFIWGFMNIPKPPRFDKVLDVIKDYPTFNGKPYYEYKDLDFTDFLIVTDIRKPPESFRQYYLKKYMETLFYHAMSLGAENKKDRAGEVVTKSILGDQSYDQYSISPDISRQLREVLGK